MRCRRWNTTWRRLLYQTFSSQSVPLSTVPRQRSTPNSRYKPCQVRWIWRVPGITTVADVNRRIPKISISYSTLTTFPAISWWTTSSLTSSTTCCLRHHFSSSCSLAQSRDTVCREVAIHTGPFSTWFHQTQWCCEANTAVLLFIASYQHAVNVTIGVYTA